MCVVVVVGAAVVEVDAAIVVVVVPPPHPSQQLGLVPTEAVPPAGARQEVALFLMLQLALPFALVRQQVTAPGLPCLLAVAQSHVAAASARTAATCSSSPETEPHGAVASPPSSACAIAIG